MDYEKSYKDALDRARKIENGEAINVPDGTSIPVAIFPELKESEGEGIKKEITDFIRRKLESPCSPTPSKNTLAKWISWFEKQSKTNIQNNNPLKIESDNFYFCIKDYFAGGCYRSKKGEVVLAQNGMNMMGLSPKEASEYFIPVNHFNENVVAWFKKQGEEKSMKVYRVENEAEQKGLWRKFDGTYQPLFDMLTDGQCKDMPMEDSPIYREGGKRWFASAPSKETLQKWFSKKDLEELISKGFTISEFEVVGYKKVSDFEYIFTRDNIINRNYLEVSDIYPEQKDFAPKFKVGDWIAICGNVLKIRCVVDNEYYCYETLEGCIDYMLVSEIDYLCHLWSIEDAEDGDVLFLDLMGGKTFIYNGINPNMAILYSFIVNNDGEDVLHYHIGKPNVGIGNIEETKNIIHPATKEQRELLFHKLKDAGYEWDGDNKKLKKIEQAPTDKVEPKFKVGDWIACPQFISAPHMLQVIGVKDGLYELEGIDGFKKLSTIGYTESIYYPWTIQDARDGDVLVCESEWTCIFKTLVNDETFGSYCFMDSTGWFCELGSECHTLKEAFVKAYNGKIQPATKRQRDFFFKKMQDSGYEWDAKKKVLKNLKSKFKVGDWVASNLPDSDSVFYITDVSETDYKVVTPEWYYVIPGGQTSVPSISKIDKLFHLWTVKDAKDGDILAYETDEGDLWVMIYRSLYEPYEGHVHYHALLVNDNFTDKGTCCIYTDDLKLATKEQRELLFQRMKEAGYVWNGFDKKLIKL